MTEPSTESGRPAPFCAICGTEMTLTIESYDNGARKVERREWSCPRADKHPPPRWWESLPPP